MRRFFVAEPVAREIAVGANSWYRSYPASDPLDVHAGVVFKVRQKVMTDKIFIRSCELAGIPATPRQARKWLRGTGLALRFRNDAKKQV
jgi:hypothetical protein